MKLRVGRHNPHTIYLQTGNEPADTDRCIGMVINPDDGGLLCEALTSPWHLNEMHLNDDREPPQ